MKNQLNVDTNSIGSGRPNLIAKKLIGWGIGTLGFLVVAYFAWYRLPNILWHWANMMWWHWILSFYAYLILFSAPILNIFGAVRLTNEQEPNERVHLWWMAVTILGWLAGEVLILWAFTTRPDWWISWYWWLWGVALVVSLTVSAAGRMFGIVQEVHMPKVRETFSQEWQFNHGDFKKLPPELGLAMSGGGLRSAAFNLGVLHALHDNGLLRRIDVMSAVSGGSYTMSWYFLQLFYAKEAALREKKVFKLEDTIDEMFRANGRFQKHLCEDPKLIDWKTMWYSIVINATVGSLLRTFTLLLGFVGQYNNSSFVRRDYRESIQKLFHGLPSLGSPSKLLNEIDLGEQQELVMDWSDFSYVTPVRYRELAEFAVQNGLPFFIFNAAVLVNRTNRNKLQSMAFELTANDIGSDICGYRSWEEMIKWEVPRHRGKKLSINQIIQYRKKSNNDSRKQQWILMVNLAPAISGAAIGLSYFNPKKNSSEMKLRTWTPFISNVDLGYLLSRNIWDRKGVLYVSDGGHSENLGAYALIKRQCRKIIIVDAEHEKTIPYVFDGYTKLKERLEQERELMLTVSDIDSYLESAKGTNKPTGPTKSVMTGEINPKTSDITARTLSVIYIKLGLDRNNLGSYPPHVREYTQKNKRFPHDPTTDQVYTNEQFVAYRELGHHVAAKLNALITDIG